MDGKYSKQNNSFLSDEFVSPPDLYAPVYNWVWNGPVSHEETDKQLDEMLGLGIKAVCIIPEPKMFRPCRIPTMLEPDYLTPAYFEEYKYAVLSAKKRNMHMWLYDEGGWPSGGACGKVMLKHPEFAPQVLEKREKSYKKEEIYHPETDVVSAFLENEKIIEDGYIFESDCTVTECYIKCVPFESPGIPELPDVTIKEATDSFIDETHEGYKPYLNEFFGEDILAVFSDEPVAPRKIPFRKGIEDLFYKENGYSIKPFALELLKQSVGSEEGAKARIAWFDLCSRLFCDNYLKVEKEWTNRHKMAFMGHMDLDHLCITSCIDSGSFNVMRALRNFDIPAVDVIWRQIFPYYIENPNVFQKGYNGIFPRYASSAATQNNTRYAATESFGVYGAGIDFNQMRYILNYQAVRGINVYNIFGVPYAREGHLMMGELPYFTEKHGCYKDLKVFNEYVERLSYLASLGKPENNVALYIPVRDVWAGVNAEKVSEMYENTGRQLENKRILFDIADDDVFLNADKEMLNCGKIVMGGACYDTIVVPVCSFMPDEVKNILSKFSESGGKVIELSDDNINDLLSSKLSLSGDAEGVRLAIRSFDNGKLYILFNETTLNKSFSVSLDKPVYILDAENGRIIKPKTDENGVLLNLASGQSAFLLETDEISAEKVKSFENEIELSNFTFKKVSRFVIGDMHFSVEEINEEEKEIKLGNWFETVGVDFSGSGIYKTEFSVSPEEKVKIDLGEVYCSAEVFVNGKSYGIKVMAPYEFEIPAKDLKENNILEIRVTNTAANEYNYTKSFDKWQPWQLPYMKIQNVYHEDSLSGGLIGPIKVYF